MEAWYSIYVAGGLEEQVKEFLEIRCQGEEALRELSFIIFKRKLKERKDGQVRLVERKLFPGYLLVKGEMDVERYRLLKELMTNGKFLKEEALPAPIDEKELQMLGLLSQEKQGEIGISSYYKENDKIKIVSGPLFGFEGHIVSVNERKQRAKVKISFMGEIKEVELGVELVNKS